MIHDLSLDIAPGEVFSLLGPNGAGKTTTLRLTAGLVRPDDGGIRLNSRRIDTDRRLAQREIGYLPDIPFVYPSLTGREMLMFVSDIRQIPRKQSIARIEQLLNQFELADEADRLTSEYSLGMKRKLGLCIALLHNPTLLLLDEPLNGLDPSQARLLKQVIAEMRAQNCMILMSTHRLATAQDMSDTVAIISKGRLVGEKWSPARQPGTLEEQYFHVLEREEAG